MTRSVAMRTTAIAALATVVAAFLPWARSGEVVRNSFQLIDVAERAGLLPSPWAGLAPVWFLLPAGAGLLVITAATGRPRMTTILGGVIGLLGIIGSTLLFRSPLTASLGPTVALLTGMAALASALWSQLFESKGSHP